MRTVRVHLAEFWERAYREGVTGLAAMVAYNLLLAVFPFTLLVLFLFGRVLESPGIEETVILDLERLFPDAERDTLEDALDRIREGAGTIGLIAGVAGVWIGMSFWGAMDTAFCRIYHVRCRGWLEQKRWALGMLVVAVLFLAATVVVPVLEGLVIAGTDDLPLGLSEVSWLTGGLLLGGALGMTFLVGGLIYWIVPKGRVPWKAVWPGALLLTTATGILNQVFPLYLGNVSTIGRFGNTVAFALVALIWFYAIALAILAGAVVNALRFERHDRRASAPRPGADGRGTARFADVSEPIPLEDAREAVVSAAGRLGSEQVALGAAIGRVVASPVRASHDVQPFDNSAMDGYAVRTPLEGAPRIVGESRAGHPFAGTVEPGQAVRISTGAALPAGADAVVPIERASERDGNLAVEGPVGAGDHIRRAGEDAREGQEVIPAGTTVGPAEVAAAAACGAAVIECARRPRVRVLATGDELVPPGESLAHGQVHESNALAVAAQARQAGAEVVGLETVGDDPQEVRAAVGRGLDQADLLCVCGGVSVGPHDHVKPALEEAGVEEAFWRISLKPGKPTWFGRRGETLVLGLPGNPVSAMVVFELLGRPAIDRMLGRPEGSREVVATLSRDQPHRAGRTEALRCRLVRTDAGWEADPAAAQGSHVITSMVGADGLAILPADRGDLAAGETVRVILLGG